MREFAGLCGVCMPCRVRPTSFPGVVLSPRWWTQVWPKNGRYVSMSDETVNMISRRYMCNPKEVVSLNVGRVHGLRPGALLYEGTILQLPQNSEFVRRPVGTDRGKWDQLDVLVQERLEASPCLGRKPAKKTQPGGVEDDLRRVAKNILHHCS